jgi:hypothetical protein
VRRRAAYSTRCRFAKSTYEADKLADQIIGDAQQRQLPRHSPAHASTGGSYEKRTYATQNQAGQDPNA